MWLKHRQSASKRLAEPETVKTGSFVVDKAHDAVYGVFGDLWCLWVVHSYTGRVVQVYTPTSYERGAWRADQCEEWAMSFLSKAKGVNGPATAKDAYDSDLIALAPAVHEFLTASKDEDLRPRKTSTLTFFSEAGLFKVCLNEREQGLTLWATSDTFEGCLVALESILAAPVVPWRVVPQTGPQGQKKK